MDDRVTDSVPDEFPLQPPALAAGAVVAGRYVVADVLGAGGSAVVYRAFDRTLRQDVALKVLRRERTTPASLTRLRREVAVARNVASPHLVRVFDIAATESDTFVTMELIEGESLRARVERGPLPIDDVLRIAEQLLEALAALHAAKVVHRDIKPSNVLMDRDGDAKLADFGLAVDPAADGERATQTGALVGTAEYMSPEQIIGTPLDARSDLYSFGVLLYECLTGQLPFGSRSTVAAMLAHVRERPRSVRHHRKDVPRWFARLVSRLLEKDRAQRVDSASAALRMVRQKRVPLAWSRIGAVAAIVTLIAGSIAGGAILVQRRHAFESLRPSAKGGIEAIDRSGNVLWRREDFRAIASAPGTWDGRVRWIAAMPARTSAPPGERSTVSFLDPENGRTSWTAPLPNPATSAFPQFPDLYSVIDVRAVDLDRDGSDEVSVAFVHEYWPAYLVVYDVEHRSARAVFVHSGGLGPTGVADVNGDGRNELIVTGLNNRFGWYSVLAALDIAPIDPENGRERYTLASSPDTRHSYSNPEMLLWYQLMQPYFSYQRRFEVDTARRTLTLDFGSPQPYVVSFDGFLNSSPSNRDAAARNTIREAAWESLRRADQMLASSAPASAIEAAAEAMRNAEMCADPVLLEVARRAKARAFIRLGRVADAEAELRSVMKRSPSAPNIAFDAARHMHLGGLLPDAVRWYRVGLLAGDSEHIGRFRYEFVQGAVLALVEMEKFDEAEQFLTESRAIRASFPEETTYRNYVRWRRGRTDIRIASVAGNVAMDPDLHKYWTLEFRHATGELRGRELAAAVAKERARGNLFDGLLLSLESVALAEAGDAESARRAADTALDLTEPNAGTDTVVRAHITLVRDRARSVR